MNELERAKWLIKMFRLVYMSLQKKTKWKAKLNN